MCKIEQGKKIEASRKHWKGLDIVVGNIIRWQSEDFVEGSGGQCSWHNILDCSIVDCQYITICTTIIAYEYCPASAVRELKKRVFATITEGNYNNHNAGLIIWMYDSEESREELLRNWMVD